MAEDPWAAFRTGAEVTPAADAAADPWTTYRAPGTASPVVSPRAPVELRASPEDKYKAKALADYDKAKAAGFTPAQSYSERIGLGTGLGWTDDLMAGASVPFKMIQHGTLNPAEAYRYGRADIDLLQNATRENTKGFWGTAAELTGGLVGAGGVLGGAGATAKTLPFTSRTIPAGVVNYGSNIAKGAGLGAVAGAGEAETVEGIPKGLMLGGILGGLGGAAAPVVAGAIGHGARALQMPRLRDPENIAIEQVAAAARAGGVTPQQILERVRDANAAGQPFTVADAIGKEGHRKLGAVYKGAGPHREEITQTLVDRDLNMPYRVTGATDLALGAGGTAKQQAATLAERAKRDAGPLYREAEQHPTWSPKLQEQFLDNPIAHAGLREGVMLQGLRNAGTGKPFKPQDAMITDFNAAGEPVWSGVPNMQSIHTLKTGLDAMIRANKDPITGALNAKGDAIAKFQRNMLAEIDAINPAYAKARALYADPMQVRDAIDVGKKMATRGRPADTVPAFNALREGEQQGVRTGYADTIAEKVQGGDIPSILRNKNIKGREELDALSLHQGPRQAGDPGPLRMFLNREEVMKAGTNKILGGSDTAEKIADMATAPGAEAAFNVVKSAVTGDPVGAGRAVIDAFNRIRSGESEAQRVAITKSLLERLPDRIEKMAERIAAHEERRRGVNPWTGTFRLRPGE
jgi:hypothetical protein